MAVALRTLEQHGLATTVHARLTPEEFGDEAGIEELADISTAAAVELSFACSDPWVAEAAEATLHATSATVAEQGRLGPRPSLAAALTGRFSRAHASAGLEVAVLSEPTRSAMAAITGRAVLPGDLVDLDLRADGDTYAQVCDLLAADPGVDAVLALYAPSLGGSADGIRGRAASITNRAG